jgi:hypothetical protein
MTRTAAYLSLGMDLTPVLITGGKLEGGVIRRKVVTSSVLSSAASRFLIEMKRRGFPRGRERRTVRHLLQLASRSAGSA